jgi:hypothetical protein
MIYYSIKSQRAFCLLFTENVRWLSLERNQNAGHIQPHQLGRKQHHQGMVLSKNSTNVITNKKQQQFL